MTVPARKPALSKAPAREHPVAPTVAVPATDRSETVMLSARVPADFRRQVKRYAVENGISVQEVITEALRTYLDPSR